MQITWIGCAQENMRKGRPTPHRPVAIVVHIIVGSLRGADGYFNDPGSRVSAHYGVGKSGEIHQYVNETDTAFHAGIVVGPTWKLIQPNVNPNFYTIGIEHEGLPEDIWPEEQISSSAALIGDIANRWEIKLDRDHVIAHHEIRASKTCPGSRIDVNTLISRVPAPSSNGLDSPRSIRILRNARLRSSHPSTSSPIVRVLPAGTIIPVSGFITGERVSDNPIWYKDFDDNYIWAGATDIPSPGFVPRVIASRAAAS